MNIVPLAILIRTGVYSLLFAVCSVGGCSIFYWLSIRCCIVIVNSGSSIFDWLSLSPYIARCSILLFGARHFCSLPDSSPNLLLNGSRTVAKPCGLVGVVVATRF